MSKKGKRKGNKILAPEKQTDQKELITYLTKLTPSQQWGRANVQPGFSAKVPFGGSGNGWHGAHREVRRKVVKNRTGLEIHPQGHLSQLKSRK